MIFLLMKKRLEKYQSADVDSGFRLYSPPPFPKREIETHRQIRIQRERERERERERREKGVTVPDLNYLQSIIADY